MNSFLAALSGSLAIVLFFVWFFPTPEHPHLTIVSVYGIGALVSCVSLAIIYVLFRKYIRGQERHHEIKWKSGQYDKGTEGADITEAVVNEARAYREAQKNADHGREFVEGATLVLLGFAAWIGFFQWQTLEKTDQTLRLQGRAWIAQRGLVPPENFKAALDKYTEVTLRLENIGREPAISTAEVVATEALPNDDFRNDEALGALIQKMLDGRTCDSIPINPNGRAIFPGGTPAIIVGFEEEKVIKINKRTHFALVAGCFVYETMNETHRTGFCLILEPPAASKDWRSDTCPIHNDAQ
jgi:hypothetical protein